MGGMRRWGLKIRLRLDLLTGCNRFGRTKPVSVLWIGVCHAGVCLPDVRQHAGVGGYCGAVGEGENVIAVMYFMEVQIVC